MNEVRPKTLDSGLKVYHVNYNSPLTHVQLFTPFGGDTLQYRDGDTNRIVSLKPGSAHYFEHVLFLMPPFGKNGKPIKWRTNIPKTKKNLRDGMTELQLNKAIVTNAYTWNDITNYYFVTRQNVLENLGVMVDFVLTPYLPQDRFKKEVGTIMDEAKRSDNNPFSKQSEIMMKQLYVKHGARFPVIGTLESIPQISLDDVLSMHATFYRPSNMYLVVTGKADIKRIAEAVAKKLESLGKGSYLPPPEEVDQEEPNGASMRDNFDNPLVRNEVPKPRVLAGWKQVLKLLAMKTSELIDLHLAGHLVCQVLYGRGGKNREELVKKGVDERTFESGRSGFKDHALICLTAMTENPGQFRDLISDNGQSLLRTKISPEEVEYARNYLLTDEDKIKDSIGNFGNELARWGVLTGDPRSYFRAVERLEKITADEVNALLPKILIPENLAFTLMVPGSHQKD